MFCCMKKNCLLFIRHCIARNNVSILRVLAFSNTKAQFVPYFDNIDIYLPALQSLPHEHQVEEVGRHRRVQDHEAKHLEHQPQLSSQGLNHFMSSSRFLFLLGRFTDPFPVVGTVEALLSRDPGVLKGLLAGRSLLWVGA